MPRRPAGRRRRVRAPAPTRAAADGDAAIRRATQRHGHGAERRRRPPGRYRSAFSAASAMASGRSGRHGAGGRCNRARAAAAGDHCHAPARRIPRRRQPRRAPPSPHRRRQAAGAGRHRRRPTHRRPTAPPTAPKPTPWRPPRRRRDAPRRPAAAGLVQVTSQRSEDGGAIGLSRPAERIPSILGAFQPNIQRADLGDRGIYLPGPRRAVQRRAMPSASATTSKRPGAIACSPVDCITARQGRHDREGLHLRLRRNAPDRRGERLLRRRAAAGA